MSDHRQRTLDRAALADPEARERALRSRLRLHPGATEAWELPMPTRACTYVHFDDRVCAMCRGTGQVHDPHAYAEAVAPLLVAAFDREELARILEASDEAVDGYSAGPGEHWLPVDPACWSLSVEECFRMDLEEGLGPRLRDVVREAVEQEVSR